LVAGNRPVSCNVRRPDGIIDVVAIRKIICQLTATNECRKKQRYYGDDEPHDSYQK
jgi:hypothetical protein